MFYGTFNSILSHSKTMKGLCAMKGETVISCIPLQVGFKPTDAFPFQKSHDLLGSKQEITKVSPTSPPPLPPLKKKAENLPRVSNHLKATAYTRVTTLVTFGLLSCTQSSSQMGFTLKGKNRLPREKILSF